MRLQAKNIFLTYPRCWEQPDWLIDFLLEKLESRNPLYICVSEELHEDGTPHLHAFISLDKKLDTTNERYFDLDTNGPDGLPCIYHPNIQKSLKPKENLTYVKKDGNFEEWGEIPDWLEEIAKRKRKDIFADAFSAPSKKAAKEIILTEAPDVYATSYNNISAALKDHFDGSAYTPYESSRTLDDFNLPDTFWDWYNQNYIVSVLRSLTRTRLF